MARRKRLAPTKMQFRSSLTNGSRLLIGVDGRSAASRRYRDLFCHYLEQTHGAHEELCKQAAALVMQRELLDATMARGEYVDTLHFVRLSNALTRTIAKLDLVGEGEGARRRREQEDREAGLLA